MRPADETVWSTRPVPSVRRCPDCNVMMRIGHAGHYVTLYVCRKCGLSITEQCKTEWRRPTVEASLCGFGTHYGELVTHFADKRRS